MEKKAVRKAVVEAISALHSLAMTETETERMSFKKKEAIHHMFQFLVALSPTATQRQEQTEQVTYSMNR